MMPYDSGENTWKIICLDEEGVRAGLLDVEQFDLNTRGETEQMAGSTPRWRGQPKDNHFEVLYQMWTPHVWYVLLYRFSRKDYTDEDYARIISDKCAADWLHAEGYPLPNELKTVVSGGTTGQTPETNSQLPLLPRALKEIWDLLANNVLMGKELAKKVRGAPVSEDSIRKRISALKAKGYEIDNIKGQGYCRPDALPL